MMRNLMDDVEKRGKLYTSLRFSHICVKFLMGNMNEVSDEDILAYLKAGWHFHRKVVRRGAKEYEYIIRRRGQETASIGRYDEETWKRFQRLREQTYNENLEEEMKRISRKESRKRFVKARENIITRLSIDRGGIMARTCIHVVNDFCSFWTWPDRMPFTHYFDDVYKENVEYVKSLDNSDSKWIVRAHSFYCANCGAYQRKIQLVKVKIVDTHA